MNNNQYINRILVQICQSVIADLIDDKIINDNDIMIDDLGLDHHGGIIVFKTVNNRQVDVSSTVAQVLGNLSGIAANIKNKTHINISKDQSIDIRKIEFSNKGKVDVVKIESTCDNNVNKIKVSICNSLIMKIISTLKELTNVV